VQHPEWRAPAAVYPSEGEPSDAARGYLDPSYTGRPLPFLERIEMRLDKEDIPRSRSSSRATTIAPASSRRASTAW
jgi:hypothetical protein